jgi:tocopherol O-methyltransferase
MTDAGLEVTTFEDLTLKVTRTWEICKERVNSGIARFGARLLGREMLRFVEHFDAILSAYRTGAMRYGLFVAERASSSNSR